MSAPNRPSTFDSATLNRAAHVLRQISPQLPADATLRQELKANRALSAAARSAVSRVVFIYFRWRGWLLDHDTLQRQLAEAVDLQARFDRDPNSIKPEALAARAVPAWIADEVALPAATLRQWQQDPWLWLRARPGTAPALARELGHCQPPATPAPLPPPPDALVYQGLQDLHRTDAFQRGAFEIQDLASQYVGLACAPQPGQTWWDACAGEGGKTLHLADQMANRGVVWASDRSLRRLDTLKQRFARAQLFNVRVAPWKSEGVLPTKTKFDGVLVDAPCSGLGTWQRNPHARWTTQPSDVAELAAIQAGLLESVAGSVKPGGRLVYAVCTLTRSETTAVSDAFTAAHAEFEPTPLSFAPSSTRDLTSYQMLIYPDWMNSNGMFLASWRRR